MPAEDTSAFFWTPHAPGPSFPSAVRGNGRPGALVWLGRVGSYQEGIALSTTTFAGAKPRIARPVATDAATIDIPYNTLEGLTEIFQMLGDASRLKILLALAREGEMHVSALCGLLGQSQPAVSHHLTLLRRTKLVRYRRDGKHNYYCFDSGLLRALLEQLFSDTGNGSHQIQFDNFSLAFKTK